MYGESALLQTPFEMVSQKDRGSPRMTIDFPRAQNSVLPEGHHQGKGASLNTLAGAWQGQEHTPRWRRRCGKWCRLDIRMGVREQQSWQDPEGRANARHQRLGRRKLLTRAKRGSSVLFRQQ